MEWNGERVAVWQRNGHGTRQPLNAVTWSTGVARCRHKENNLLEKATLRRRRVPASHPAALCLVHGMAKNEEPHKKRRRRCNGAVWC